MHLATQDAHLLNFKIFFFNRSEDSVENGSIKSDKVDELTEEELIDRIVAKLRPTIKDIVAKEKRGESSTEASTGILTSSRY
jgi:hypothetical protein